MAGQPLNPAKAEKRPPNMPHTHLLAAAVEHKAHLRHGTYLTYTLLCGGITVNGRRVRVTRAPGRVTLMPVVVWDEDEVGNGVGTTHPTQAENTLI